ncbi:hypothetical protein JCGZ_00301 [Jatropha curcas]|uniref:Uncharacterized protein n=1 Tax=Jatropha curcas TaxID=180498 RepID=A0A067LEI6_JATCU|nr:hypothetical protein JCGZ_00301 [Jatropha curcas]
MHIVVKQKGERSGGGPSPYTHVPGRESCPDGGLSPYTHNFEEKTSPATQVARRESCPGGHG